MINTLFANSYPEYFFFIFSSFFQITRELGFPFISPFVFLFEREREFRASVHIGTGWISFSVSLNSLRVFPFSLPPFVSMFLHTHTHRNVSLIANENSIENQSPSTSYLFWSPIILFNFFHASFSSKFSLFRVICYTTTTLTFLLFPFCPSRSVKPLLLLSYSSFVDSLW